MSKFTRYLSQLPTEVRWLLITISIPLAIGNGLAITILLKTSISDEIFSRPICLRNECVKDYTESTEQAFTIAKATMDFGVAIATIGGIFVALLSYFNTASNAALTNHIEHLKVFSDYLDAEIKKRDRLSAPLIDTLLLYSSIFSQSRNGKTTVSNEYIGFIEELNKIIEESNARCVVGTPGGFSYANHQRQMRDHVIKVGIHIHTAPRNDYFEMEEQLLSLLHRLSQSFCQPSAIPVLKQRSYC